MVVADGCSTTMPELRRWLVRGPSTAGISSASRLSYRPCLDNEQFAGILDVSCAATPTHQSFG
jgi:hypothetical protein